MTPRISLALALLLDTFAFSWASYIAASCVSQHGVKISLFPDMSEEFDIPDRHLANFSAENWFFTATMPLSVQVGSRSIISLTVENGLQVYAFRQYTKAWYAENCPLNRTFACLRFSQPSTLASFMNVSLSIMFETEHKEIVFSCPSLEPERVNETHLMEAQFACPSAEVLSADLLFIVCEMCLLIMSSLFHLNICAATRRLCRSPQHTLYYVIISSLLINLVFDILSYLAYGESALLELIGTCLSSASQITIVIILGLILSDASSPDISSAGPGSRRTTVVLFRGGKVKLLALVSVIVVWIVAILVCITSWETTILCHHLIADIPDSFIFSVLLDFLLLFSAALCAFKGRQMVNMLHAWPEGLGSKAMEDRRSKAQRVVIAVSAVLVVGILNLLLHCAYLTMYLSPSLWSGPLRSKWNSWIGGLWISYALAILRPVAIFPAIMLMRKPSPVKRRTISFGTEARCTGWLARCIHCYASRRISSYSYSPSLSSISTEEVLLENGDREESS